MAGTSDASRWPLYKRGVAQAPMTSHIAASTLFPQHLHCTVTDYSRTTGGNRFDMSVYTRILGDGCRECRKEQDCILRAWTSSFTVTAPLGANASVRKTRDMATIVEISSAFLLHRRTPRIPTRAEPLYCDLETVNICKYDHY
ncbi:hypothetical protein IG631_21769 [Alternaria alternata]|nr:hypothetical protein IG631_21769 [Alternaria alternata]